MEHAPPFTEKMLKRLIERFKANYLTTLHANAGTGGPFTIDPQYRLRRGDRHLGQLTLKGGRVVYDPPIEQVSGVGHAATEADIRHWALAAWDKAPKGE